MKRIRLVSTLAILLAGIAVPATQAGQGEGSTAEPRKGFSIFGRVVGPEGEAIANAAVEAAMAVTSPADAGAPDVEDAGAPDVESTVTGADGRFEVTGLAAGTVTLIVRAGGYPKREVEGLPIGDDAELGPVEIRLEASAQVSGRVVAPDGSPAPGTWLSVVTRQTDTGSGQPPAPPPPDALIVSAAAGRSDAGGEFVIRGATVGPATIEARHDRLGDATVELEVRPGDNAIELILDLRGRIQGRAVDRDGEPVPGAHVELAAVGRRSSTRSARTDSEGRFVLRLLAAGDYRLDASAPGLVLEGPPVAVTLADTPAPAVELVLAPGAEIAGRLLGVPEAELLHLQIGATLSDGDRFSHRSASPGPDGRFRLTGLAPGRWSVQADGASGRSARAEVEVAAGGGPYRLDPDLGGGLTLTGSVRAAGEPLARASVALRGVDVAHSATVDTAFDGSFQAAGLEPGRYEILVSTALSRVGRRELVLTADEEIQLDLPAASLSGRVVDAAGDPVPGAQVIASVTGSLEFGGMAFADAAGRFAVPHLEPGRYAVRAWSQGPRARATVSLAAGDQRELELRMEEGFELAFAVLSSSGGSLDRIQVIVFRRGEPPVYAAEAPVAADGTAVVPEVPPGEWLVAVSGGETALVGATVSVPGPPIALTLPPSTTLEIEVPALADLGVVPFALVGPDGHEPAAMALDTRSLYRGQAAIDHLPPGTWTVTVAAPDGRDLQGTATTAADRPAKLVLD